MSRHVQEADELVMNQVKTDPDIYTGEKASLLSLQKKEEDFL